MSGSRSGAVRRGDALTGTGALIRTIVGRDRVRIAVWLAAIVVLVASTAASTKGLFPTQADLDEAAAAVHDNRVALAFNGPDQALDTLGGQVAFQVGAFGLTVVGLMSILMASRLTRGEEDSGRMELIRALPVGRHAPFTAGLVVVAAMDIAAGALVAGSLALQDLPVAGSVALGASYTVLGLLFAAVTAVTAQALDNPRVAAGSAGALLGASFAVRAIGDVGSGAISWLSPIGWAQKTRPYAGEQWWPLLLCVGAAVLAGVLAIRLGSRRDFGAGLVVPRRGPSAASPALGRPIGLTLRLQRAAILWWALGVGLTGLVYGSIADSIEDFLGDGDAVEDMIARAGVADLTDSYLATSLLVLGVAAGGFAVQSALRLRGEEAEQRVDAVLATGASRWRWMGAHAAVAGVGSVVVLAGGGLGLGIAYAAVSGDPGQVARLAAAALAYAPAVWVLAAVALAGIGLAPRWATTAWAALAACFVVALFGTLLDLPSWVLDLSPFEQTPQVPAVDADPRPLAAIVGIDAALAAVAFVAYRRRDLGIT